MPNAVLPASPLPSLASPIPSCAGLSPASHSQAGTAPGSPPKVIQMLVEVPHQQPRRDCSNREHR